MNWGIEQRCDASSALTPSHAVSLGSVYVHRSSYAFFSSSHFCYPLRGGLECIFGDTMWALEAGTPKAVEVMSCGLVRGD
jgi:hypothetical protein